MTLCHIGLLCHLGLLPVYIIKHGRPLKTTVLLEAGQLLYPKNNEGPSFYSTSSGEQITISFTAFYDLE